MVFNIKDIFDEFGVVSWKITVEITDVLDFPHKIKRTVS